MYKLKLMTHVERRTEFFNCREIFMHLEIIFIFILYKIIFIFKKQWAHLQHSLRRSTWVINFGLYIVGTKFKELFSHV